VLQVFFLAVKRRLGTWSQDFFLAQPVAVLIRTLMSEKPEGDKDVWNDEAFRSHAVALCLGQGRSAWETCRTAGLAGDYLTKPHGAGRNIRALIALAGSLKVDVSELVDAGRGRTDDSTALRRMALASHIAAHLYVAMDTERRSIPDEAEAIAQAIMSLVKKDRGSGKPR
jgi:hypothetical protein